MLLICQDCNKQGSEHPRGNWRGFKTGTIICKSCYYKQYAKNHWNTIRQTKIRWIKADSERFKKTQERWYAKNYKKTLARVRKYQASKLNATPPWLTKEQLSQIEWFYINCLPGMHVDHIIPLQGKNVCGLHVPWNLQHLPASKNHSKGNKVA